MTPVLKKRLFTAALIFFLLVFSILSVAISPFLGVYFVIVFGGGLSLVCATLLALSDRLFFSVTITTVCLLIVFVFGAFLPTHSEKISLLIVVLFLLSPITICYKSISQGWAIKLLSLTFLLFVVFGLFHVELINAPWLYKKINPASDLRSWVLPDTPCLDTLEPSCLLNSATKLAVGEPNNFQKMKILNNIAAMQLSLGYHLSAKETLSRSINAFHSISKNYSGQVRELIKLALLYEEVGDHENFRETLLKATNVARSTSHLALSSVAVSLSNLGFLDESRELFIEAIERPGSRNPMNGRQSKPPFSEILSEQIFAGDLDGAISSAGHIKDSEMRDRVLHQLCKKLAYRGQIANAYRLASSIGELTLKDSTQKSIDEIRIKNGANIQEILTSVGKISDSFERDKEIWDYISRLLKSNHIQKAIKLTTHINDTEILAAALLSINKYDKKYTSSTIKEIMQRVDGLTETNAIANTLMSLAVLQEDQGDNEGLEVTYSKLIALDIKDKAINRRRITKIFNYLVKKGYQESAFEEFLKLSSKDQAKTAQFLSVHLAKDNYFDAALKLTEFIEPEKLRLQPLYKIAILQYKSGKVTEMKATLGKVLEVAWEIPNKAWIDHQRDRALQDIIALQTLAGLHQEAFQNMQYIEGAMYRKKAVHEISIAKVILGDLRGAVETLWPLQDPQYMLDLVAVMTDKYETGGGRLRQGLCTLETVMFARLDDVCEHLFR